MLSKLRQILRTGRLRFLASRSEGWVLYESKKLGLNLLLNKGNYIDFLIWHDGGYQVSVLRTISVLLKKCGLACFVDVGSNIGQMSLFVSRHFPQVKIYSFEPVPSTFIQQQSQKVINNLEYHSECIAIGDRDGVIVLHGPVKGEQDFGKFNAGMYSVLRDGFRENGPQIEVPVRRLDALAIEHPDDFMRPMLLKIDVEGAELLVLKGMKHILAGNRMVLVLMEINIREYRHYADAAAFLTGRGYRTFDLHMNEVTVSDDMADGDFVFLPPTVSHESIKAARLALIGRGRGQEF
jgi:FkbM family methyltransferase